MGNAGVENVRVAQANAPELLDNMLEENSVDELWVFFPDPWHKSRHHKRRLVSPAFADKVARVLKPGGIWRLATDLPRRRCDRGGSAGWLGSALGGPYPHQL